MPVKFITVYYTENKNAGQNIRHRFRERLKLIQ